MIKLLISIRSIKREFFKGQGNYNTKYLLVADILPDYIIQLLQLFTSGICSYIWLTDFFKTTIFYYRLCSTTFHINNILNKTLLDYNLGFTQKSCGKSL